MFWVLVWKWVADSFCCTSLEIDRIGAPRSGDRRVTLGLGIPSDWIFELVWASALSTWLSGLGGLIHAAVGSVGGFGATPLKRSGWAMNAAASVTVRCRSEEHTSELQSR